MTDFSINGGITSVFLDLPLLESAAGLVLTNVESTGEPFSEEFQVGFPITPETDFTFEIPFSPVSGSIEHSGDISFALDDAEVTLGDFSIGFDETRVSETTSGFFVADTLEDALGLEILFDVGTPETVSATSEELTIADADLLLAPEFADALALPDLEGADVGNTRIDASATPNPINDIRADFNNDGISDLVWRNFSTGDNGYWFMNDADEGGSFGPIAKVSIPGEENLDWAISGTGDFNGNGTEDILWRNFETGQNGVWLMNGVERNAIRRLEIEENPNWYIGGAGDANGDSIPDLYWRNAATGANGLWYLNEDLSTAAQVSLPTEDNLNWELSAVDDMNEDNVPDLIWRNQTSGQNGVWLMGGQGGQEVTEIVTIDEELNPAWEIRGTGDYNSDGFTDLVWRNLGNGNNGVWLYDGELNRLATVAFETETNTNWQIVNR